MRVRCGGIFINCFTASFLGEPVSERIFSRIDRIAAMSLVCPSLEHDTEL